MFSRDRRRLVREIALVFGWAAVALLAVALFTYSPEDPAWSFSDGRGGADAEIQNRFGVAGAYIADILISALGRSSYLLCLIALVALHSVFSPAAPKAGLDRLNGYWAAAGVLLFILSSAALENIRFARNSDFMPSGAGGGIGKLVAEGMLNVFGQTGASALLLCIWIVSWSLAANLSWFSFFEIAGEKIETVWARGLAAVRRKNAARRGRRAEVRRAASAGNSGGNEKLRLEPYTAVKKMPKMPEIRKTAPPPPPPSPSPPSSPPQQTPQQTTPGALPSAALLDAYECSGAGVSEEMLAQNSAKIEETLASFGVSVKVLAAHPGPVITRYDIRPDSGVKGAQIVSLVRDVARSLSVEGIRILETIPGKDCMGLEIPNQRRSPVYFSDLIADDSYANGGHLLPLALGKDAAGNPVTADLAGMPHLLVAGATGSGKSVCVNAMLLSLLFSAPPEKLRLILIDPKMLELASYRDIPHLLAPVVTDVMLAPAALNWAVEEMESRYRLMSETGARSIDSYNEKTADSPLPYIVIVIDELADLMMTTGKKVEITISRLAQKARAAGIHLILATQRPSVDVITGLIKANVPARIAFQVASKVDSRTIIDQMGADMLLGMGDMLYLPAGAATPLRVHGSFVSDEEVRRVAEHLRSGRQTDYAVDFSRTSPSAANGGAEEEEDELYRQAVEAVMSANRPSISLVQRKLRIGYNRAARLIENMERAGIVSAADETGARKITARGVL